MQIMNEKEKRIKNRNRDTDRKINMERERSGKSRVYGCKGHREAKYYIINNVLKSY